MEVELGAEGGVQAVTSLLEPDCQAQTNTSAASPKRASEHVKDCFNRIDSVHCQCQLCGQNVAVPTRNKHIFIILQTTPSDIWLVN